MNQDEQTPKRTTRRTPKTSYGRRFSKVDSYAWLDIRRDHDLPFVVASFLRMITELADYHSRIWTGTITELHEQTGMARKTISAYLEQLDAEGLIVAVDKAHGSRPSRIDVSLRYDELIVPNQRQQQAAAKQNIASSNTRCVSSASFLSQMTRPTRENNDSGGIEAIEDENVQASQSQPNALRSVFEAAVERWSGTRIQELLDAAIKDHGLDPSGYWWVEAETNRISGPLKKRLEFIAASFENF